MAWFDRLREAAYTSPSGTRFVWAYEDVSREVDKATSAHRPAAGDGTFVQDLGRSGYRYPLRVIFSGADYDLDATAFEDGLLERGPGLLEHPLYGVVTVVPFGSIARRDDLKSAGNQAIIEVVFWETTASAYPLAGASPRAEAIQSVEDFNAAGSTEFADGVDVATAADRATFSARYRATLAGVRSALQPLADTVDATRVRYDAIADSLEGGLDVLVGQPLTLATQSYQLVQAPARTVSSISDQLSAYGELARVLTSGGSATRNDFRTTDLFASGAVSASVLASLDATFSTRGDAVAAADQILTQFADVSVWRETQFAGLGEVDSGSGYQALQAAAATAAAYLVELSFSLAQERTVVVDRPRTIIDLASELYGEVDARLDDMINLNNLSGSEILELPRGRAIVYYL